MLLMEFHGSPASVKEQAETVQEIASEFGGQSPSNGPPRPRSAPACGRRGTTPTSRPSRASPGCRAISTDTCVPISRLADCLLDSVAEADASGMPYFLVGHVGDGNFHFGYLIDPDNPRNAKRGRGAEPPAGAARASTLEGTCTGEHGVGLHKMGFSLDEAGAGRGGHDAHPIKRALDPKNIMNPGKIARASRPPMLPSSPPMPPPTPPAFGSENTTLGVRMKSAATIWPWPTFWPPCN
jgi:D-lactate dehydrogenase (cytochrome)